MVIHARFYDLKNGSNFRELRKIEFLTGDEPNRVGTKVNGAWIKTTTVVLLFAVISSAQALFPIVEKQKVGFIDPKGNVVIAPKFNDAGPVQQDWQGSVRTVTMDHNFLRISTILIPVLLFSIFLCGCGISVKSPVIRDEQSIKSLRGAPLDDLRKVVDKEGAKRQSEPVSVGPCFQGCSDLAFGYIVVSKNNLSSEFARMEVFLDPKAFTPENLRSLFVHLAKSHPRPENLVIKVKTDWSQLQTLSGCGGIGSSRGVGEPDENYTFHRAEYYRRGENEFFYYTTETGTVNMQKVVISGTFQPKQRWELEGMPFSTPQ